jgi:hypothetical protein
MFNVDKPASERVFLWQQGQRMSKPEHDAKLHVPAERKVP